MSDNLFIRKLYENKLNCLNEINFRMNLSPRMPVLSFFHGLIFADEFKFSF